MLPIGLGEEGVVLLLGANGGGVAVAGSHDGVVGQGEQLGLDAADEPVEVAARQVGSANASFKQRVARDDGGAVGHIQANAAWRVAGCGDDHDFLIAEHEFVAVLQCLVDVE